MIAGHGPGVTTLFTSNTLFHLANTLEYKKFEKGFHNRYTRCSLAFNATAWNRLDIAYNNGVNFPDHRPIRVRLWPWLLRKYVVDGTYSWWGTTCWRGEFEDPWTAGRGSSGVLLYPPRTPDERGPIDSIRWELFREGLEDYEYIALADELARRLEEAGDVEAARVGREAVEHALSLVERWPRVRAANDEPYTLDVQALDDARAALASAIEQMQNEPGR